MTRWSMREEMGCREQLPSRQQRIQLKTWLAFTERLNHRHLEPLPRQVIVERPLGTLCHGYEINCRETSWAIPHFAEISALLILRRLNQAYVW